MYFSDKIENVNKDKFNKLMLMLNSADEGVQSEVCEQILCTKSEPYHSLKNGSCALDIYPYIHVMI